MTDYKTIIQKHIHNCLEATDLGIGEKIKGKVRDSYRLDDKMVFVTTDRQSAFDRILAAIPFKGQVLNQTSAWWFERTKHIIPNHVQSIPDPNVTVGTRCEVFPVEFVMRGYITGSTSTSLWTVYNSGSRNYCGNALPEGLVKNQKLAENLITPTTKDAVHDRPISPDEIIAEGLMSAEDWAYASAKAQELFAFGQEVAKKHGLILVDTKYEMGKDAEGNILLIDEIHTPDSSRYWIADSYEERIANGQEPENIDKEFLRLWFKEHCDPYHDEVLPSAPAEMVVELSRRYIQLYEMITGETFQFPNIDVPIQERIQTNLAGVLS
ncbi:MAG: phosphoribosylaminoimidazolesuccinocarboxamide synthase [Lentisphaeria bacterium]|nr:phosphoribosylaminoimidazolesuccinocarboxamide synthase [Candidatus Neomarinimicrobiota bacterium]MCF7842001.1 phosphoribosylaminoimidazolesuccinocarboxamide synthase [Lentisphaeria bacterium]